MSISLRTQYKYLIHSFPALFNSAERKEIRTILAKYFASYPLGGTLPGHTISDKFEIIEIVLNEIGLGKAAVLSVLFHELVEKKALTVAEIEKKFNTQVSSIINGMMRVEELYARNASLETENFRKLFLTFAEDVRVILIIIAEHLQIMRTLDDYPEDKRQSIAREASFLYAPLAHRMGLYAVKTEL